MNRISKCLEKGEGWGSREHRLITVVEAITRYLGGDLCAHSERGLQEGGGWRD